MIPKRRLFLLAFVVYNLNLRPIPAGDTVPAALLPFSILLDHSMTFDRFQPWYARRLPVEPGWFVRRSDGHYYSMYPVLLPLLLTPAYAPLALLPGIRAWPVERLVLLARVMEKLAASAIAALSVVAFYLLVVRLAGGRAAFWLTLVYAFASPTWTISSQALWQHGASELAIVLTLLLLSQGRGSQAGLCAAASVAFRPTNLLFLVICVLFVCLAKPIRTNRAAFVAAAGAGTCVLVLYNLLLFHTPAGGYGSVRFNGNILAGLSGLFLSPSRGLFVFSPVFLGIWAGVYRWLRGGPSLAPALYGICLVFSMAHTLLISRWQGWWGGFNYGPRLLTDIVPCLVILMIPTMRVIERRAARRAAFVAVLAYSISVQAIGALCYPNGHWDAAPQTVDAHPERLWDWRDNQILRTAAAGPILDPYRLAWRVLTTGSTAGAEVHIW